MRVRLLTYNIHKAIGVDRQFSPERIVEIIEHYDPDICLLQEVDRGAPRSNQLDLASWLAQRLRYDHRAVGMNVYLKVGRYGNATLSRWPIGRQRNIDLSVRWMIRRGAQHTTVYLPFGRDRTLDVFNIHLGLTAQERAVQMRRLLAAPEIVDRPRHEACIIAGDMNDWRGMLKRRFFVPAGFDCATNRRPGSRWAIRTFPSYAPTGGLDKVFFRGPLKLVHARRSRLKLARVASDHLPVIVDFDVKDEPEVKGI